VKLFTDYVQDPEQHYHFSLGSKWWAVVETPRLGQYMPNSVTLLEQIGATRDDFENAFGKKFRKNIETYFPSL
jgi:hypothetical protein